MKARTVSFVSLVFLLRFRSEAKNNERFTPTRCNDNFCDVGTVLSWAFLLSLKAKGSVQVAVPKIDTMILVLRLRFCTGAVILFPIGVITPLSS